MLNPFPTNLCEETCPNAALSLRSSRHTPHASPSTASLGPGAGNTALAVPAGHGLPAPAEHPWTPVRAQHEPVLSPRTRAAGSRESRPLPQPLVPGGCRGAHSSRRARLPPCPSATIPLMERLSSLLPAQPPQSSGQGWRRWGRPWLPRVPTRGQQGGLSVGVLVPRERTQVGQRCDMEPRVDPGSPRQRWVVDMGAPSRGHASRWLGSASPPCPSSGRREWWVCGRAHPSPQESPPG